MYTLIIIIYMVKTVYIFILYKYLNIFILYINFKIYINYNIYIFCLIVIRFYILYKTLHIL